MRRWWCHGERSTVRRTSGTRESWRDTVGDKGGKKDKEKGQKQHSEKQKQDAKAKQDKQPKRKNG